MRVFALYNSPVFGGPEKCFSTLANGLKQVGHSVVVGCSPNLLPYFRAEGQTAIPIIAGPKLNRRNAFQLVFTPLMILYYYWLLRRLRKEIDVIFTEYKKEQMIVTFVARILGIPIVWKESGPLPPPISTSSFWKGIYAWFAGKTFAVLPSCKAAAESLIKAGVDPNKVHVVYNGIDLNHFRPATAKTDGGNSPTIGIVARISGQKGHTVLIRAMRLVVDKLPDVRLLVIGDGPYRQDLEELVAELGLTNSVIFTGFTSDVPVYLEQLRLFVLPSDAEGLPVSVIEAMAKGLPVIASRTGGIPELVLDGETGFLVDNPSPENLSYLILRLLNTPELAERMGQAGYAHAVQHFSMEKMVAETEKILLNAIATGKH